MLNLLECLGVMWAKARLGPICSRHALLGGLSAWLIVIPCAAHHSFAMFDMKRTVTLHGTVKQFQWSNPHCYIQLLVPAQGTSAEWSIEMSSKSG